MRTSSALTALFFAAFATPAAAQQVIQIPLCAGTLPSSINPSAPTITVNPSGQVCIAGNFSASVTVPTPQVAIPQPLSVVITTVSGVVSGAYADGALVTLGSVADGAYTTIGTSGDVIALLKGIFANLVTPIAVTGSFSTTVNSPIGVNIAATTPINVTVGGIVSPQNVTVGTSPLAVTIASSPVNVTGNFTTAQTGQNIVQLAGQQLASPTTYGIAPVGSTQGVNAFVTNNVNVTTPTPLQITLPASPVSVGLPATPFSVVVANAPTVVPTGTLAVNVVNTPQVLIATSPVGVTITSSPINVTGNFTSSSPQSTNLIQVQNQNIASPSTYGVAPVGSVQGVNAFVTSLPGTPLNVTVGNTINATTTPSVSPQNVTVANNVSVTTPTPLQVTFPASPLSVGLATGVNLTLVAGQTLASPTAYGVAPIGTVIGVNAFVTSLPGTPISVIQAQSPQNVTFSASPLNVTQVGQSGQNFNLVQWQGIAVASPTTYGVAPVGSTGGLNAFVTNGNPNGSATSANSQPVVIASDQTPLNVTVGGITSPLNVTLSASPMNVTQAATPFADYLTLTTPGKVTAHVATTSFAVTGAVIALGATPGVAGPRQLSGVMCAMGASVATPQLAWLQLFDTTAHATGTDVTLGTTLPKQVIAIITSPQAGQMNNYYVGEPGVQYTSGISFAFTTGAKNASAVGANLICTISYN